MSVSDASLLPLSWAQEDLSLAYVASVAASAGVAMDRPARDANSEDVRFWALDDEEETAPELRAQLKCTFVPLGTSSGHPGMWRFQLKAKNYNDLRRRSYLPRVLVVVLCPPNRQDWTLHCFPQALVMQAQAWWVSLAGAPELPDGQQFVTVSIPQGQRFDTAALLANMRSLP